MFREVLHLKIREGMMPQMQGLLPVLLRCAAEEGKCHFTRVYFDDANEGWILVDQEWESADAMKQMLQRPDMKKADEQMKSLIQDGRRMVLREMT